MNTEQQTTIRITLDTNKQLTVEASKVALPQAIQLCLAAIEAMCKQTLARAEDPALVQSLEEDMYDMINMGASTLLARLFPNIEMRPDLTVDALLKAEDAALKENAQVYADAYNSSAQAQKDVYEHNLAKAQLAMQAQPKKKKAKQD